MSIKTIMQAGASNGKLNKSKAFAIAALLAMSATPSLAYTSYDAGPRPGPRAFRGEIYPGPSPLCTPANGAEVLGGFAGPHDLVDPRNGLTCGRW